MLPAFWAAERIRKRANIILSFSMQKKRVSKLYVPPEYIGLVEETTHSFSEGWDTKTVLEGVSVVKHFLEVSSSGVFLCGFPLGKTKKLRDVNVGLGSVQGQLANYRPSHPILWCFLFHSTQLQVRWQSYFLRIVWSTKLQSHCLFGDYELSNGWTYASHGFI